MTGDWQGATTAVEERLKRSEEWITVHEHDDPLDDDGYPTETALDIIREWPFTMGDRELFVFIKSIWWMADWGWKEGIEPSERELVERVYRYRISTGGWSGNESIIQALQENKWCMWYLTWVQSRRGGHYIFELRDNV